MGPKRDKSKKEKMRETRRQGDPSFPGGSSSHQASRIPRPSILLSNRQNSTQQRQSAPAVIDAPIGEEPHEATAASKATSSKGLRVTFDLSKNIKSDSEDNKNEVAECWEDLSDDGDDRHSDDEYAINDDDVIDLEKELGGIGDDLIDFGHASSNFSFGRDPSGRGGGGKVDLLVGPSHFPKVNDLEDFGAIGDDDSGSDYDNVDTGRQYLKNGKENFEYQEKDKTPVVNKTENVISISEIDAVKEIEPVKKTESEFPAGVESNIVVTIESKEASHSGAERHTGKDTNKIPYIDSTKGGDCGDDDDDEWETDPSGGSDESGKIYKIDTSGNFGGQGFALSALQVNTLQDMKNTLTSAYDESSLADQPSLCDEDDSDIITNEHLDAAFQSVMKEDEEALLRNMSENIASAVEASSSNSSGYGNKLEVSSNMIERNQNFSDEIRDTSLENLLIEDAVSMEENPQSVLLGDKLHTESACQKNLTAKSPDKTIPTSNESGQEAKEVQEEAVVLQESLSFVGPLENPDILTELQVTGSKTSEGRIGSPEVSIGFECREAKHSSETESEGELVLGEDKCVGTADQSDDEPLDLSVSERTSSRGENDMSESRDSSSLKSEDESQSEKGNLALDDDKHEVDAKSGASHLSVPIENQVDLSSSPEIPLDSPLGSSESNKEKEKKIGKKKGKKNKRDGKSEQSLKSEDSHPERPKLVRGKSWKEKREKFKTQHGDAVPLSFGKELCESEIVEGTSNLLTETYTEASVLTANKCSTGTTIVTETPCTACSSVTGEFSESESLCKGCLLGEKKRAANAIAQVTEIKPCDENICHTPTVTQPSVILVDDGMKGKNGISGVVGALPAGEKDDFYVVKACEVAMPLEVLTEYVADSESSEETNGKNNKSEKENTVTQLGNEPFSNGSASCVKPEPFITSNSNSSSGSNSVYTDAKDSSCADQLKESYDYVESFPDVIGTQNINYIYSYDGSEHEHQTGRPKLMVKPLTPSLGSSGVMVVNAGEDSCDDLDTDTPLTSGEIVYEGPCMCGPDGKDGDILKGNTSEEDLLCVPPLFGDFPNISIENDKTMGVETHEFDSRENMGSNSNEALYTSEGDSKNIRSRIKEIVGPRLQQKRGRQVGRRLGGSDGVDAHPTDFAEDEDYNLDIDFGKEGRDESPMPGSSPASSSGVQGSDEMSPSCSRSRSPSREDSASPPTTTDTVSDLSYEPFKVYMSSSVKVKDNLMKGGMEASPEKGSTQVDYSFKTFRDMYQINPVYTTDSDDHDDLNESDTIVQDSPVLSYDPDRPITVSSLGSTSEESPAILDPNTSPPLPSGVRSTKKVPKVTKQLRETQGIVQRWEVLQAQAVERQRQTNQVRELQRQVKNLRIALENLAEQASGSSHTEMIDTHEKLNHKLQDAKVMLEEVKARKSDVTSLNVNVHRFLNDSGYSLPQLKDEVNDLYIVYDEAQGRAQNEVSRLEGLEATWKLWEAEMEELTRALRHDGDTLKVLDAAIQTGSVTDSVTASMQDVAKLLNERCKSQQPGKKLMLQHTRTQGVDIQGSTLSLGTTGDDCLSDSGTSGYESCSSEELSERERRLAHLRRLARDLEASLSPDSQAWQAITKTLSSAEQELKGLQKHCRELVVRSTETLDQTKTSPQLRRRTWAKDAKAGRMTRGDRRSNIRDSNRGYGRRGFVWRVVRAALPFQAALLLLFCVACLLEPNCCDTHNSLTMTLTPQLRYVHGPPPV